MRVVPEQVHGTNSINDFTNYLIKTIGYLTLRIYNNWILLEFLKRKNKNQNKTIAQLSKPLSGFNGQYYFTRKIFLFFNQGLSHVLQGRCTPYVASIGSKRWLL